MLFKISIKLFQLSGNIFQPLQYIITEFVLILNNQWVDGKKSILD